MVRALRGATSVSVPATVRGAIRRLVAMVSPFTLAGLGDRGTRAAQAASFRPGIRAGRKAGSVWEGRRPATASHSRPDPAGQAGPRVVAQLDARREVAAQAGPADAVVELDVLAGVERLVEQADRFKHGAAVGDGHAVGRHEALGRRVDVRLRVVPQAG